MICMQKIQTRRFIAILLAWQRIRFSLSWGSWDPPLIDYLSDLLVRFVRSDVVHRMRSITGRPLMTVAEMIAEATERLGGAQRELHRHIGDFTLFWAGVYPEALCKERSDDRVQFERYCNHGKRSYHIAATIEVEEAPEVPCSVLESLSEQFELCAYGLREVRREWEGGPDEPFGPGSILLN